MAEYSKVDCIVLVVREKSVLIEVEGGHTAWIGRSCIHGGDEIRLDGSEHTQRELRIMTWLADKEGLL